MGLKNILYAESKNLSHSIFLRSVYVEMYKQQGGKRECEVDYDTTEIREFLRVIRETVRVRKRLPDTYDGAVEEMRVMGNLAKQYYEGISKRNPILLTVHMPFTQAGSNSWSDLMREDFQKEICQYFEYMVHRNKSFLSILSSRINHIQEIDYEGILWLYELVYNYYLSYDFI